MRVVLDTNVLVSALLVQGSIPDQVLRLAVSGKFVWLADARIYAEYVDVMGRPEFGFDAGAVDEILAVARDYAEWIVADPLPLTLRDRSDLPFVEVAVAGGADVIVTGNQADFRVTRGRLNVRVLSPRQFLDFFAGR